VILLKFDIDYIAHNNRLSDTNVYLKVILGVGLMILTLIMDNLFLDAVVFALMGILVVAVARVSVKSYIKFLTIPIIFAVITCIFLIFFFGSGKVIFDTGIWGIVVTQSSLDLGIKTFCRCFACFSCLGFVTLTTPIADLLQCLHVIKVPVLFIDIALLMYNTIFIFLDQLYTMRNAQETRLGYMGSKSTYKSLGMLFSNLFFRSLDKSETLQCSLDSRCYQGYLPVYKPNRSDK
jgi:cobalt/nickel transport system permease protein